MEQNTEQNRRHLQELIAGDSRAARRAQLLKQRQQLAEYAQPPYGYNERTCAAVVLATEHAGTCSIAERIASTIPAEHKEAILKHADYLNIVRELFFMQAQEDGEADDIMKLQADIEKKCRN